MTCIEMPDQEWVWSVQLAGLQTLMSLYKYLNLLLVTQVKPRTRCSPLGGEGGMIACN